MTSMPTTVGTSLAVWIGEKFATPILVGATLAVLGSFLFAQANERYRARREHLGKAIDGVQDNLRQLVKVSASYWSTAYDPKSSPAFEAEIDWLVEEVGRQLRLAAPDLWGQEGDIGPGLLFDLLQEVAPNNYGTADRQAEPARGRRVAVLAAHVAFVLGEERRAYLHRKSKLEEAMLQLRSL